MSLEEHSADQYDEIFPSLHLCVEVESQLLSVQLNCSKLQPTKAE